MTLLHEILDLRIECEKKPVLEEEEEEALTVKLSREVLQTVEQDFDGELRIPEFGCRDLKATRGDAQPWKKTLLFVEKRPESRNGFCTIFIIPFDIAIASISKDNDEFPKPYLLLSELEMHKKFQSPLLVSNPSVSDSTQKFYENLELLMWEN